jgi:hypothetical protein
VLSNGGYTYIPTDAARAAAGAAGAPARDKADSFVVTVDDGHGGVLRFPVRVEIVGTPPVVTNL